MEPAGLRTYTEAGCSSAGVRTRSMLKYVVWKQAKKQMPKETKGRWIVTCLKSRSVQENLIVITTVDSRCTLSERSWSSSRISSQSMCRVLRSISQVTLPLNIKDTVCIYEDIFFESCFAFKVNIEVFCGF